MQRGVAIGMGLMAVAAAGPAAARDRSSPARGDLAQYFGPDQYPPDALRAAEQGRVVARLEIDSTGKVASCTVTGSSGSTSLDQTTCRIALAKVILTPATDRQGRPIASTYTLPVRWVLPTGGTPNMPIVAPGDQDVEMTVSIDAASKVVACEARATPALRPQQQPCDEFPVGQQSYVRWTRDGRAVGGTMTKTYRVRVRLDR